MINPADQEFNEALNTFYHALLQDINKLVPGSSVGLGQMNNSPLFILTSPSGQRQMFRVFLEITPEGMAPTFEEIYI